MGKLMRRTEDYPIQTIIGGVDKDVPMVIWNCVMSCADDCPTFTHCTVQDEGAKCSLMKEYFSNILNSAIAVHGSYMNPKIMTTIGTHLMPLYSQLFRFKLIEKNMKMSEMVVRSKKGDLSMHPLYKEMRELLKLIDGMWTRIGMRNFAKGNGGFVDAEDISSGDSGYYESISSAEYGE